MPHGEYSNLVILAVFSSKSFSGQIYLPVKNSYLLTFPDDKTGIFSVCQSKLY